ncbi:MAG: hypothetical protein KKD17_02385 [Nanoarchaeota archaeon]|nr:hypothetical protein [Nanoarchaeota archaeon]
MNIIAVLWSIIGVVFVVWLITMLVFGFLGAVAYFINNPGRADSNRTER